MGHRREFLKQAGFLAVNSLAAAASPTPGRDTIVVENAEMRLVISSTGIARSLIHKASGQECLESGQEISMFSVTQERPYDNELQLSYPAKPKAFAAENVRRENDRLVVTFELVGYEASIRLRIADSFIGFTLESLEYKGYTSLRHKRKTEIDSAVFLQLPVRNRKRFGEWLNVMWDDEVAVNVLGTDPYARVDSTEGKSFRILQAGTVDSVKTNGVGGALIVTESRHLLDRIAKVEDEYRLPKGVASRRRKEYRNSYYEVSEVAPDEIDRHT